MHTQHLSRQTALLIMNNMLKRIETMRSNISTLLDSNKEKQVASIKEQLLCLVDKAIEEATIEKDLAITDNKFILTSKTINSTAAAKEAALKCIRVKAKEAPSTAIFREPIEIKGRKSTFYKIETAPFNFMPVSKPDDNKKHSIGNELLKNIKEFNDARRPNEKIYITKEYPRSLKAHYQKMEEAAYKIRQKSDATKKIKITTKTTLDRVTLRPMIKCKIFKSKKALTTEWLDVQDANTNHPDIIEADTLSYYNKIKMEIANMKINTATKKKN